MDWVEPFYSRTGAWWGEAQAAVDEHDRARARFVRMRVPGSADVLELGCGYGSTAVALADEGFSVTAIDFSDRILRASDDRVRFVQGDFFSADFGQRFDAVCYWDGFGVGSDADQVRLLDRVHDDWMGPDAVAFVEVFNPVAWEHADGFEESKAARPDDGYPFALGHRRRFDRVERMAMDTWWEIGSDEEWTQSLRCYSPQDFEALLATTGLRLDTVTTLASDEYGNETDFGAEVWSYIAVLRNDTA